LGFLSFINNFIEQEKIPTPFFHVLKKMEGVAVRNFLIFMKKGGKSLNAVWKKCRNMI